MRWLRSKPKRIAGEYPESFVQAWMAQTLPTTTPAEADSAVRHLRSKGWSEQQLAELILPYMPREERSPAALRARAVEQPPIELPPVVSTDWLDARLPALDRGQIRLVVDELERRGWPPGTVALAVLPHLLPKLPAEDAQGVVAGLARLGMTEEEIARVSVARRAR